MAKNSCSVGLNIKIDKIYSKLDGHQQVGAVYLWLMLDTIVNITADVAKGLKEHIKLFGQKGLQGMYPAGENVERMVMDYTSICDTLDQQKILPDDSIYDIIQGLSLASHVMFSKMFADMRPT